MTALWIAVGLLVAAVLALGWRVVVLEDRRYEWLSEDTEQLERGPETSE